MNLMQRNKKMYSKGDIVELVFMDDPQSPPLGTRGRVLYVDDIGTIHIAWENGSSLGALADVDIVRKVN